MKKHDTGTTPVPGAERGAPGGPVRRDTRGIVDSPGLLTQVRYRRHAPAAALRPWVELYWLIDWDLSTPYVTQVLPHPCVNLVLQRYGGRPAHGTVSGPGRGLFTKKLEGRGRVCGAQFRAGGFRPFAPGTAPGSLAGREVPLAEVFGTALDSAPATVLGTADDGAPDDGARVAAMDTALLSLGPAPDPRAALATRLVEEIRADRGIARVGPFARAHGLSVRALQRLFATYVGAGPKEIILRYRIHEALERPATTDTAPDTDAGSGHVDWAALAAELGYADQAHLTRDFTRAVGVPPDAYASGMSPGSRRT